mmetsp:Transcript_12511/g.14129  ORF Transcript_12511/g.14129 Transcript_12511/m.14129 type:complete len:436 (+) Transcript_12511:44-1351(+)
MRINMLAFSMFVLLLLVPITLVSATSVSLLMPRGGATKRIPDGSYMAPDLAHDPRSSKVISGDIDYERIVQSQWEKHRRWHSVSKRRKKNVRFFRISKLTFISLGAVAQIAATQLPTKYRVPCSLIGGLSASIGIYIKKYFLTDAKVTNMVTSFYISQAIKSEVCKYRAKAEPYSRTNNSAEVLQQLRQRCHHYSKIGDDPLFLLMQADSKVVLPVMDTKIDYVEHRLNHMLNNVYIKQGKLMGKRADVCSILEDVLLSMSTVISGFGVSQSSDLPFFLQKIVSSLFGYAGAFTTISTAIANHAAKMSYKEVKDEYFNAAEKLMDLKDFWPLDVKKAGDPGWDVQIAKCEDVIISTVQDIARSRSGGNKNLTFQKPKISAKKQFQEKEWNPNAVAGNDDTGSYLASERAAWLIDNESMTQEDARRKVMDEFPDCF